MIIDIHNHIGLSRDGTLGKTEELLEQMDSAGIDRSFLFTIDEVDCKETYQPQNDKVAEAVSQHSGRLVGICRVIPKARALAVKEMERTNRMGMRGLKLHPKTDQFRPEESYPMIEAAQAMGWPVLIHTDHHPLARPETWKNTFTRFPKTVFILMHGGKDLWIPAGEIAKRHPNVYIETSTLSYNRTRGLFKMVGPEKILFGSDYPYDHPCLEKMKFDLLVQDREALERIFHLNAAELFGL